MPLRVDANAVTGARTTTATVRPVQLDPVETRDVAAGTYVNANPAFLDAHPGRDPAQVAKIVLQAGQQRRALLDWKPTFGYPYDSFWTMIEAQRLADITISRDTAIATADVLVDQIESNQAITIQRVWELTTFPAIVQRALAAGAIIALAGAGLGAAIGSAVPVIGTIIGAAIGFVVGCITAAIPIEQWKVLDDWAAAVKALFVVERYLIWKAARAMSNRARCLTSPDDPKLGPWDIKDAKFLYTIYTADGVMTFQLEALARSDCFPWPPPGVTAPPDVYAEWPNLEASIQYAILCLLGFGKPEEKVKEIYTCNYIVNDGLGSQWLKPYLVSLAEVTRAQILARNSNAAATVERAVQIAQGRAAGQGELAHGPLDYDDQPYPPHIVTLLQQREAERCMQLAAASK